MADSLPHILAVETSGHRGSIALATGTAVVEQRILPGTRRRHAQMLVQEVDQLLRDHNLVPSEIDVVAVSYGPGSFTGLRVGVTFAKTFCWANNAEILAIDTLQALAQRVSSDVPHVGVVTDAQREELFYNDYRWDHECGCRRPVGEVRIETPEDVAARHCAESTLLTGQGIEKHAKVFVELKKTTSDLWQPTADAVATLGAIAFAEQNSSDLYALEPLYIRRSYAEEKSGSAP